MKKTLFVVGRIWEPRTGTASYSYALTLGAEVAIRALDPQRKNRITRTGVQAFLAHSPSTVGDFNEVHAWRCQVGRAVVSWAKDRKAATALVKALNES